MGQVTTGALTGGISDIYGQTFGILMGDQAGGYNAGHIGMSMLAGGIQGAAGWLTSASTHNTDGSISCGIGQTTYLAAHAAGSFIGASAGDILMQGYEAQQNGQSFGFDDINFGRTLMNASIATAHSLASAQGQWDEFSSCFSGDMPILVNHLGHWIRIDSIHRGDWVLTCDERDPNGALVLRQVEEVFIRLGQILNIHARDRIIKTTPEHPFWVENKNMWVAARDLEVGDVFRSHDGQTVTVEDLHDTGEYETVYNFRVADFHTYFVGGAEWGFSVWAHNAAYNKNGASGEYTTEEGVYNDPKELMSSSGEPLEAGILTEEGPPSGMGTQNPAVREAMETGDIAHAIIQDKMRNKGWLVDRADTAMVDPITGQTVYPDAISLQGHPVEIKPRTRTGMAAGESQLAAYERATGRSGRVIYYDPNDY